ncbi:MAG: lysine--tRNA ligase [Candidatus Aureabacteria bacterium]|nr:lysine--tRNA ligase [Candidatus Auribacterota bacterium]
MQQENKEGEQVELRKGIRDELIKNGLNPYGGSFLRESIKDCAMDSFEENKTIKVAGRIKAKRGHGKTAFLDIYDETGKLQVYVKKDSVSEDTFYLVSKTDIGDIIGVEGKLFKTRTGESTIMLEKMKMLSKSLHPLPEKWHGLTDVETRYRQRYLDLIVNTEVRDTFKKRSKVIKEIRSYFDGKGFLEVETPMMQHIVGGATAKPFKTHHNALGVDLYLRIAPELYLKRLLVGGFEKVYEINRNFRNEGISRKHNPEFTMLEVYEAYNDYFGMMELAEDMIVTVNSCINGDIPVAYGDTRINFDRPWKRISLLEAIKEKTGVDFEKVKDVFAEAKKLGVDFEKSEGKWEIINKVFEHIVEPELIQPTFIVDYPAELCPLSKTKPGDPEISERFELFIAGQELANAYSELNDPVEQRKRFLEQADGSMDKVDMDYIRALEYGMPPAGGLGIGIDRLIMVLTSNKSIRDVVLFPQLKPEKID